MATSRRRSILSRTFRQPENQKNKVIHNHTDNLVSQSSKINGQTLSLRPCLSLSEHIAFQNLLCPIWLAPNCP